MSVKFFGISETTSAAPGSVSWDMITGDPRDNSELTAFITEYLDNIADAVLDVTGVKDD